MAFKRMSEVDLRGKRVFIRSDLNVPLEDGRISDDTRIRASVPAIKAALQQGCGASRAAAGSRKNRRAQEIA